MLNVLISGQKWFGAEVFKALQKNDGINIAAVSAPVSDVNLDRLAELAWDKRVPIVPSGTLNAASMPEGIDLIVAAHSHDFIGEKTRLRATYGGIGYHPSLLPIHRGRDSVRWTIKMRDQITGGTVYRLSNKMDGGDILEQKHVFVRPGDTAEELWRRDLGPLGVELISRCVDKISKDGWIIGTKQDEEQATWETAIDRPPSYRPDLIMIPLLQNTLGDIKANGSRKAICTNA